jgi:hypothetical protein
VLTARFFCLFAELLARCFASFRPIIVVINAPPEAHADGAKRRRQETTCRFSGSTMRPKRQGGTHSLGLPVHHRWQSQARPFDCMTRIASRDCEINPINYLTENPARLHGLFQLIGFRFFHGLIVRQGNLHRAVFGAMWRADSADMGSGDPDDIGAALGLAFGLVIAGFLVLLSVGRPPVIGPTFDIEPGMR